MTEEKELEAEREAAEKVEESVEAKEAAVEARAEKAAEAHAEKAHTAAHAGGAPEKKVLEKKGLMERRESFSQSSVPNAHRGYNPKTPVVMMCIIAFMVVLSFVLAAVTF